MSSKNKKNTNGAAKKSVVSAEEKLTSAIFGEPKAKGYVQIMHDASNAIEKILVALHDYTDSAEHMKRERLSLLEEIAIKGIKNRIADAQEIADDLISIEMDRIEHDRAVWAATEAEVDAFNERIKAERKAKEAAKKAKAEAVKKPAQKADNGDFMTPQEVAKVVKKIAKDAKTGAAKVAKVTKAVRDAQGHFVKAAK